MMRLTALIPVKAQENKSRLSEALTLDQRSRLTAWMLTRTLEAVNAVPQIGAIRLIGRGKVFEKMAASAGVEFVSEAEPTLNGALQIEVNRLHRESQPCLILFADLPLIDPSSLATFLDEGSRNRAPLTLAPDAAKQGTNALLYRGEWPIEMMYGPDSYRRYLAQAEQLDLNTHTVALDALAHDLDTPDDWARWQSHVMESGFSLEAAVGTSSR